MKPCMFHCFFSRIYANDISEQTPFDRVILSNQFSLLQFYTVQKKNWKPEQTLKSPASSFSFDHIAGNSVLKTFVRCFRIHGSILRLGLDQQLFSLVEHKAYVSFFWQYYLDAAPDSPNRLSLKSEQ